MLPISSFHVCVLLLTDSQKFLCSDPFSLFFSQCLPFFLPFFCWCYSSCFLLRHSVIYSKIHIISSLFTHANFSCFFLPVTFSINFLCILCPPCFPPHFSELSTQKPLIFSHCDVSVILQKHLETRTISAS